MISIGAHGVKGIKLIRREWENDDGSGEKWTSVYVCINYHETDICEHVTLYSAHAARGEDYPEITIDLVNYRKDLASIEFRGNVITEE